MKHQLKKLKEKETDASLYALIDQLKRNVTIYNLRLEKILTFSEDDYRRAADAYEEVKMTRIEFGIIWNKMKQMIQAEEKRLSIGSKSIDL